MIKFKVKISKYLMIKFKVNKGIRNKKKFVGNGLFIKVQ